MVAPSGLFESVTIPLAAKLSPKSFQEYVGQSHLIGPGKPLRKLIDDDRLVSMIFWGPPGCGKTSLAKLISSITSSYFLSLNAVTAKIADIQESIKLAKEQQLLGKRSICFIDEIHRFSKVQQDALLPVVESGLLTLIGATTENPFFSVIPALISRTQVYEMHPLSREDLAGLLDHALVKLDPPLLVSDAGKTLILNQSNGDARRLLNTLELLHFSDLSDSGHPIEPAQIQDVLSDRGLSGNDDAHYDYISALIKSMRGCDPNAAVYWLARLLKTGEDPRFIARRLIVFASEDVGNADPQALPLATALIQAAQFIGMPEIRINLSHVVTYLACAPKSNASYQAINAAYAEIDNGGLYPVPNYLKSAHSQQTKRLGHAKGYLYSHDYPYNMSGQPYVEKDLSLYVPKKIGFEKTIAERLDFWKKLKDGMGA